MHASITLACNGGMLPVVPQFRTGARPHKSSFSSTAQREGRREKREGRSDRSFVRVVISVFCHHFFFGAAHLQLPPPAQPHPLAMTASSPDQSHPPLPSATSSYNNA